MTAANRQNSNIPAHLQPYYDNQQNGGRTWARWLTRILAAIILICLVFFSVRWLWNRTHDDSDSKPKTTTSQKQGTDSNTSQPSNLGGGSEGAEDDGSPSGSSGTPDTSSGTTSNSSSTSGNSSTTGSAGSASNTAGQSTTLTNTGPGDTVALFLAVTLAGVFLYQLNLRTKARG